MAEPSCLGSVERMSRGPSPHWSRFWGWEHWSLSWEKLHFQDFLLP